MIKPFEAAKYDLIAISDSSLKGTSSLNDIFFFMLDSTVHKVSAAYKILKYGQMKKLLILSLKEVVFIMLVNVKMPTIVDILTFLSRIHFMLSIKFFFLPWGLASRL